MKSMILILKLILVLALLFGLYLLGSILLATFTNFSPPEKTSIAAEGNPKNELKQDETYTIYNWNIGYAG